MIRNKGHTDLYGSNRIAWHDGTEVPRFHPRKTKGEEPAGRRRYTAPFCIWSAMYSDWRRARATIVSVGFSPPLLVNWLPSETKRFFTSCDWPYLLTTPSRGFSDMRF